MTAMRNVFFSLVLAAALAVGLYAPRAQAFSPARVDAPASPVELTAGGCGPGWHRNPWGRCAPGGLYGAPMYGAPVYGGGGYYRGGPVYRPAPYYRGGYYRRGPYYRGGAAVHRGPYRRGPYRGRVYR
jgi:hypothetical protein